MKIENTRNTLFGGVKSIKTSGQGFGEVFAGHVKTPYHEATEQIRGLSAGPANTIKQVGFHTLINDAISDIGGQILQEIEALCDDNGENLDMKQLNDWLTLYEEAKK